MKALFQRIPEKIIMHVDMDAFFASIEQRDNPQWKGKPLIVGAQPGNRGVVSAASYEARKFGIHSAMPINQAYQLCPSGIFVFPQMNAYAAESERLLEIFLSFSPLVERISIDEAFIDMSGTEKLWGNSRLAAETIAKRIRIDRSLTCSIGIAPNKFLAKLASDCNKPNGITETPFEPEKIKSWLSPMPISRLWGVGKIIEKTLGSIGIHTFKDMQGLSKEQLTKRFGAGGARFYDLCRGIDTREVTLPETAKSISREYTFNQDSSDPLAWKSILLNLSDDVARQARKERLKGRTVFFTYRKSDFSRHTRRSTLNIPTNISHDIYGIATQLLEKVSKSIKKFRLIGVGLTNFSNVMQTNLFEQADKSHAWELSEAARDAIEKKFGDKSIFRASETQGSKPLPGINAFDSQSSINKNGIRRIENENSNI
jgi:DNA polymerase IV